MLIQRSLPNSLSPELSFVSDLGKYNIKLLCDWSNFGGNGQNSLEDKCSLNNFGKSICTGEEGNKISCSEAVANYSSNWNGLVYKRRRPQRNIMTLLASEEHAIHNDGGINGSRSDIIYTDHPCSVQKDDLPIVPVSTVVCSPEEFVDSGDSTVSEHHHQKTLSNGLVYKRRKLQRNIVPLLSEEHAIVCGRGINGSSYSIVSKDHPLRLQKYDVSVAPMFTVADSLEESLDFGDSTVSAQHHIQKFGTLPCSQIVRSKVSAALLELKQNERPFVKQKTLPAKTYQLYYASKHLSDTGQDTAITKIEVDCGEFSPSDVIPKDPVEHFSSSMELCITVLRRHGLLEGESTTIASASSGFQGVDDVDASLSCKICSLLENSLNMLICDICDDAFHISCCHPKVKSVPVDFWYCQSCIRKRPKNLLEKSSGKSVKILAGNRFPKSQVREGPILWMLRDNQPYVSDVRVGNDFQVEVPECIVPFYESDNYFQSHLQLDLAECDGLDARNAEEASTSCSFSNWIQCREIINRNKKGKGLMCGKWRRAPLFAVQTDDWDCSCSVLWYPTHADCAVPQELETEVILEHLKYLEMLRPRLNIM